ncbi:MAG: Ig-like domain-containing protein, partial [Clostridiales bacterium]|nr:Ig-like domain-containing protein [Clostridiales bacterium]
MKKITKRLLTTGLSLALALSVGVGLAACGGDDGNETKKPTPKPTPTPVETVPNYYLAGSGSIFQATAVGEGTDKVGGEWYASYTDVADVPETLLFTLKQEGGKEYTLTADLEVDNEFAIVIVGKAWAGQMGYNRVAEQDEACLVEGGGYDTKNIKVAEAGEYTFTLDMSGTTPVITYELAKAPIAVSSVTLDKPSLTLTVGGDDETLQATVAPADAADKTVTWASSDEEVATVDQTGKVTAVAAGEATITATAGGKTAECAVTVVAAGTQIVEVTSVTLNKTAATLHVNGQETLEATVAPENATNKTVGYTSSDETVATVSATGV